MTNEGLIFYKGTAKLPCYHYIEALYFFTVSYCLLFYISVYSVFGSFLVKERKGRERKGREKKRMEEKGKKS